MKTPKELHLTVADENGNVLAYALLSDDSGPFLALINEGTIDTKDLEDMVLDAADKELGA